ncbi:MAG: type III secretion system export apparatus subunit SctT [Planctomycetota bacterium]|jgi:type III secretion protein T|nr:type III secretion system export apparatus subunit SctT [Planctomycetota bacterium]
MGRILELGAEARQFLWLSSLAMARLVPVFQIVPFLGGRHLTGLVRNSLAFALAMFLSPWLARLAPAEPLDSVAALPLIAKEAILGVIFGFLSSLAFQAASGIGFLVDNQRGLSMSQTQDPLSGEDTSPLGSLAIQTLIMVFIATGGLALFFQALLTTYAFWSPFDFWPDWSATPLYDLLLGHFSWYLATTFALAAPMLLICFLVDFGMGLMNRFASQLNVFFLAMPVKSALSLALLLVYWGVMFRHLTGEIFRLPVLWDALRQAFSGVMA